MRTQSNKQVIEPIAHAVAQLVLLNSDAELRNAPIPDLRQVASVVEEQVAGLVQVGSQMMQSPEADETLRKDMSAASRHVSEAARRLAAAADALAEDPYSHAARKDLSEAAKGLLAGTAGVLDAYDENEIRRIVENCKRATELIAGLPKNLPTDKLVETVRTMCRLFVQITKQCTVRSKELLSEPLAWRLLAAINVIERRTPLLVSACKSAALNPHNGAAVKCRDGFADDMANVCKEIERVVTTVIMDEQEELQSGRYLAAACKEISNLLLDVPHVIASHDDENLASLVGGIRKRVDVVMTVTNRLADTADQKRKQHLQAISANLQDSCELVAQAASKAAKQPGNPAAERELSLSLTNALRAVKAATTANSRAVIRDVMRGLAEIISHVAPGTQLARLYDAAVVGNRTKLDEALNVFSNAHRSVDEDASFALDMSDADPVTRRIVRAKAAQLADLLPKLASAAQAAVVNPNEQGAWAHFSAVVGAWEEAAADFERKLVVEEGIFGVCDLAAAAKDVVDARSQELAAALGNQDVASYEVAVAQLSAAVQRVNAIHRLQAVNADDVDYRRQLEEGTGALTEGLRSLSRKFSRGQSFADAAKQASEMISDRVAALTSLSDRPSDTERGLAVSGERPEEGEMTPTKGNRSEQENTGAPAAANEDAAEKGAGADEAKLPSDADVVIVDAEEPQPLSLEEAQENPIAAAAQNLKVVASQWSDVDNEIVSRANGISSKLALLGEQYKSTMAAAKKDLIEAGRSILTDVQETCSLSAQLAEACTDKRLKNNLVRAIERLPTIAQQLKIVCAVKASNPHSKEGEQQLITCAQNLSAAIQSAVQASESASIRIRPGACQEGLALRFRRNVFRGKRAVAVAEAAASGLLPKAGFVSSKQAVFASKQAPASPAALPRHGAPVEGQAKGLQARHPDGSYATSSLAATSPGAPASSTQSAAGKALRATQAGRTPAEQAGGPPPAARREAAVENR